MDVGDGRLRSIWSYATPDAPGLLVHYGNGTRVKTFNDGGLKPIECTGWLVSHENTGYAIRDLICRTRADAIECARQLASLCDFSSIRSPDEVARLPHVTRWAIGEVVRRCDRHGWWSAKP